MAPKKSNAYPDGYEGPGKNDYHETVGALLEEHFNQMQAMANQSAIMREWESRGGNKNDLKDGRLFAKMEPEERHAEALRNMRVWQWNDVIELDADAQMEFASALKTPENKFPLGTRASIALANIDGFKAGKERDGLGLADNPWPDKQRCVGERDAWAEGWGKGFRYRPPPKPSKEEANGEDRKPLAIAAPIASDVIPQPVH